MWLALLSVVTASIGFQSADRLFKGERKIVNVSYMTSFGAWFEDNPGDCISLSFNKDRLRISALSGQVWCLIFNEGQLIYPSQVEHGYATEMPSHEGMEVYVVFFDNYPRSLARRLGKVDRPLSIDELNGFIQTWKAGGEFSLFWLSISHNCKPIDLRMNNAAMFLSAGVLFGLIAWWIYAEVMKQQSQAVETLSNSGWINVVCKNGRFSNMNFNFSEEMIKVMVWYCLNASGIECTSSLTDFPDWPKNACCFRENQ